MSVMQKVTRQIKALLMVALYFLCWIAALVLLKQLILAEYHIQFHGLLKALVGALVLAKVVMVLEHVPLGPWVRAQPAWVDAISRTILYALGVIVVLVIERTIEGRSEHGTIIASFKMVFQEIDRNRILANTLGITAALLLFNVMAVIRKHLGGKSLLRLLLMPVPQEPNTNTTRTQPPR